VKIHERKYDLRIIINLSLDRQEPHLVVVAASEK